jgi:hypothetical protein
MTCAASPSPVVVVSLEQIDFRGGDERENFAADLSSDVVVQIQHLLGSVIDSACESADDVEPELLRFYLATTGDLFRVAAGIGLVWLASFLLRLRSLTKPPQCVLRLSLLLMV